MSLVQTLTAYTNTMPDQLPVKMGQSFLASAALSTFFASSAALVVFTGTLAATVTLIEAVARPIIRATFPENQFIGFACSLLVAYGSGLSLASRAAPLFGLTYKVVYPILCGLGWAALNSGNGSDFYEQNRAMAVVL